ncbi:MAG TPA: aminotransferase, partial [Acidimicrobiia bacterium]
MPVDLSTIQERVFFIAGGYKYAMSGEGACFMHCPPGYGERPLNTGWYASFGLLEEGSGDDVPYPTDGSRFSGATYDPSGIYRMDAVLSWLDSEGIGPEDIHNHALGLQELFLEKVERLPGKLMPPSGVERGNFLTLQTQNARHYYQSLPDRRVITDYRRDRLRIGFGIYQSVEDVERLTEIVNELTTP